MVCITSSSFSFCSRDSSLEKIPIRFSCREKRLYPAGLTSSCSPPAWNRPSSLWHCTRWQCTTPRTSSLAPDTGPLTWPLLSRAKSKEQMRNGGFWGIFSFISIQSNWIISIYLLSIFNLLNSISFLFFKFYNSIEHFRLHFLSKNLYIFKKEFSAGCLKDCPLKNVKIKIKKSLQQNFKKLSEWIL